MKISAETLKESMRELIEEEIKNHLTVRTSRAYSYDSVNLKTELVYRGEVISVDEAVIEYD